VPGEPALLQISQLWWKQLQLLDREGIIDAGITMVQREGHQLDTRFTPHVYADTSPNTTTSYADERLLAVNGVVFTASIREGRRIHFYPVRVPIGLYFLPACDPRPETLPILGQGALSQPNHIMRPFQPLDGELVHELAVQTGFARQLEDWQNQMRPDLTLPQKSMDHLYATRQP
jgi:hypothetical protein